MTNKSKTKTPPRDLNEQDAGVPRGDWSDEPVQSDEAQEAIRSSVDGKHSPRRAPRNEPSKRRDDD